MSDTMTAAAQARYRRRCENSIVTREFRYRARGATAAFNMASLRTERHTYPMMTPTAADSMALQVHGKPEMTVETQSIALLAVPTYETITTNEIKVGVPRKATAANPPRPINIRDSDVRIQRCSRRLTNVDYIVTALIRIWETTDYRLAEKHYDIMTRRLHRGQHFRTPYFGMREYIADLTEPDGSETPVGGEAGNQDLGRMPLRMDYSDHGVIPIFFDACLVDGVLHVPSREDAE